MIESDKVVPLFRLLLIGKPEEVADEICEDVQAIVDIQTVDATPVVHCGDCRHGKVSEECFGLDGTPLIQCQYCTLPNQPFE
jgi:hypothetical protein